MPRPRLSRLTELIEMPSRSAMWYFASSGLGSTNLPGGFVSAHDSKKPLGVEIALVTADVAKAHRSALSSGGTEISAPTQKPWGQVVSYVRAPDGTLIELCTPVGT